MNVRSRGRRLSTVLAAILVSFTGCTGTESTVDPRPTAEPAAIPDDPTADVTTIPGELALATSGVGPFLVDVPARPSGHRINVRVSCVGPGGFRVTDAQARYVFGVARCSQH